MTTADPATTLDAGLQTFRNISEAANAISALAISWRIEYARVARLDEVEHLDKLIAEATTFVNDALYLSDRLAEKYQHVPETGCGIGCQPDSAELQTADDSYACKHGTIWRLRLD